MSSTQAHTGKPLTETVGAMAFFVLILCCLIMISTMFLRSCPAILALDLQAAFNTTPTRIALFSSATLLGYGLMQVPAGLITDFLGGRKTLTLFLLCAGLTTICFAFAPNLEVAVGARFITGLSLAAVPAAGATLAVYFPPQRFAQAMGIFMASSSLGNIIAAEPLARLSNAFGWSYSLLAVAAFILMLCATVYLCVRDAHKNTAKATTSSPAQQSVLGSMLTVLTNRGFWILATWQLCAGAVFFSMMTMWAGPYLQEAYGLAKVDASRILLVQSALSIIIIPIVSALSDRLGTRKWLLVFCSITGLSGTLVMAIFSGSLGFYPLVLCLAGLSVGSTGGCTLIFTLIRQNFPPNLTGTGIGGANMLWPLCASVLNIIFGAILSARKTTLGVDDEIAVEALNLPAETALQLTAQAYSAPLFFYTAFWACSLLIALFLIRDKFEVKLRK